MTAKVRAVGFTGTQQGLSPAQAEALADLLLKLNPSEVHHGDCVGADARFHEMVRELLPDARVVMHPPTNPSKRAFTAADAERPPADYLDRNHNIADESDVLIACPKLQVEEVRSGTWATVRYARKRHVPVYLILPDGYTVHPVRAQP